MKVKRLLGSLAVAGTLTTLTLGTAVPAFAANGDIAITPNTSQAIPGSFNPDSIPITASITTGCAALCSTSLTVSLTGPDAGPQNVSNSQNSGSATVSFNWDSKPASTHNGIYHVVATASASGLGSATPIPNTMDLHLNNLPVAPTGVKVALDSSNVPVVSWNANTEPDLKGYEVFRSDGSQQGGLIAGTSFRDAGAPQGQAVGYKVAALRNNWDGSSLLVSTTSDQTGSVTPPAPVAAGAGAQALPQNIATVDPPPTPKAVAGKGGAAAPSSVSKQALSFGTNAPAAINGPTLPTRVVQLPQPNVVQFAPLLPYSGKIPEVPVGSNVPAPVAAQAGDSGSSGAIALPGGVKVTPVDAIKYVATAAFLIVAAVHITRFARKLRNAPV